MSTLDPPDDDDDPPARATAAAELLPRYRSRPREFYLLWFVALLTYGVGDVATTAAAVYTRPGLIESNPLLAAILARFGLNGFLGIKLAVFLVMLGISVEGTRNDDRFTYYWPPVATAAIGGGLTAWNLYLLATVG